MDLYVILNKKKEQVTCVLALAHTLVELGQ